MQLSDLNQEIQQKMRKDRALLHQTMKRNTPFEICFTNEEGTRYFKAIRKQHPFTDDKGNYMPYGGGSYYIAKKKF